MRLTLSETVALTLFVRWAIRVKSRRNTLAGSGAGFAENHRQTRAASGEKTPHPTRGDLGCERVRRGGAAPGHHAGTDEPGDKPAEPVAAVAGGVSPRRSSLQRAVDQVAGGEGGVGPSNDPVKRSSQACLYRPRQHVISFGNCDSLPGTRLAVDVKLPTGGWPEAGDLDRPRAVCHDLLTP